MADVDLVTDCALDPTWAAVEIERLTHELEAVRWTLRRLNKAYGDLYDATNAIDALHQEYMPSGRCETCDHGWPCPTARLLHPEEDQ